MLIRNATTTDIDTLARTLYGEARGEGMLGAIAVAWVVLNRVRVPAWWSRNVVGTLDGSIAAVCWKPYQFSCWLEDDPNYSAIRRADWGERAFRDCLAATALVVAGLADDPTSGADHYHHVGIAPTWADDARSTCTIGSHRFYCLGPYGHG